MDKRIATLCAAVLLAACNSTEWGVHGASYAINPAPGSPEFSFAVHVNQLKQLGGDVKTPQFQHFMGERLKRVGLCPGGWEVLPCTADGSCVRNVRHTVTVYGRCLAP